MSTADRRGPARPGARGFSLIELVATVSIVALMTLVIERTISGVTENERTMRAIRNTSERGQRAAFRVRDLVSSARKVYQDDTVGQGYLQRLAIPTGTPILPGSRMPKFDEIGALAPDAAGDPRTGNMLLFVREADPLPCMANAATKKTRLVDTYRFCLVHLTATSRTLVAGGSPALDLVEWRSVVFPSYPQVMAITDATERSRVVAELYNRYDVDYLWDVSKPVTSAFYAIDGVGTVAASPSTPTTIPRDANVARAGSMVPANIAVAYTDMASSPRKPVFTVDAPATWTPHGFETKVVGPSGSRKIWMRLTVEQQAGKGRVPAHQTAVVATTRDA